jgi:hypothetical protein
MAMQPTMARSRISALARIALGIQISSALCFALVETSDSAEAAIDDRR